MDKKVKSPKIGGVCKVPVVMQLEYLECGAACLAMILAYYDKWIPLEQVRSDCGVSRDGSNAKNIIVAARNYGLVANGYKIEPEVIREKGIFPCIIHWNFNHFVVLDGFKGNKAYLNDPARGAYSVSMEAFDKSFTGVCLMFEPGEEFEPEGAPKSVWAFAKKRLAGTGVAVAFTALTAIIAELMQLISPGFSRVFLDRLLTRQNPEWVVSFFVLLFIFTLIQIIVSAIQSVYSRKINGKMAAVGNTTYIWKVLNLPMNFFSQRMSGDIQSRQGSNSAIASTLIDTLAPLALKVVMMVFYLIIMIRYSLVLTFVGITSLIINGVVSNIISKKRVNVSRVSMMDSAKLSSATLSGIEMIETIKASGAENGYFTKWSGYQANVNCQQSKFDKINAYLGMIPSLVSLLANNIVLFLGVYLVINGKFTVGMIMAFQGFLGNFMSPAMMLVSSGQTITEMRTQMERIEDVMEYKTEEIFLSETDSENEDCYKKLSGKVEIKNVTFGYSPLGNPIICDFNLNLDPGKSVAIVGASGSGKSTMSKLISGLYRPWSGEILFDGKPLSQIRKSVFYSSLAVVDQDIILFEDTIANNIKMWDDSIEDFEMIMAAKDAQLHYEIMQRPNGYNHKLTEGGKNLSGGQRQRVEIARVLAQDPTIIILDEATSSLDAKTEYEVVKSIKDRGISCIVIAHRLSTIRDCDEIIVLENGIIVDRGTHNELMKNSTVYQELVTNE